jgi:hypothetical protein
LEHQVISAALAGAAALSLGQTVFRVLNSEKRPEQKKAFEIKDFWHLFGMFSVHHHFQTFGKRYAIFYFLFFYFYPEQPEQGEQRVNNAYK